jgi:hypothetical protein
VLCAFHSRDSYHTTVDTDGSGWAPVGLKIYKHSSNLLQFFGTFILGLYAELLSAIVMFIKLNANGQVHPSLDTIQIDNS